MRKFYLPFFISLPFLVPESASAHAFGALYNLPVPFWMYLYGGAAAIVVSFVIIGYLFNKRTRELSYPTISLSFTNKRFLAIVRTLSVFLFSLTILSGLIGENSSYANFNMTFFWIIFLLGLMYTVALIGNIYETINPWKIFVELFDVKTKGIIQYPKKLGYYPALLFYFLLIWFELLGNTTPATLSIILVQYTLITALGIGIFGKDNWFKYCEFFSVFFRLISKIAPIEYKERKLMLRPPFVGLLKNKAEHFSLLLFILFMLSSTAYDGFRETTPWIRFYFQNFENLIDYDLFQTIGLALSPLVFLVIYLVLVTLAKVITKTTASIKELSLQFAFTLIPIAFVYNIAHYYTLIFTEGPNIIAFISDPFGFGWNLFNTANYYPNIILDANFVWHSQVVFILLGHIVGVYLAHLIALNVFPSHKRALASQIPMLILMVSYTMIGLWILSQPIGTP